MHRATPQFWKRFDTLPRNVKNRARDKFKLLSQNPTHPSLQFKKIGAFWSARVSLHYRALAVEDGPDFIWVWIGKSRRLLADAQIVSATYQIIR